MSSPLRPLYPVLLTVLIDLLGFGLVIPLMSYYAGDFGATPTQVTLLMASYSIAQFLFAPVWGSLSDRIGRRPIMLFSIAGATLCLAGFASATSLWQLFLFRALHGICAANISTAQAYVADMTTPENRSRGMGMIGASFGVGFTLGPLVGGELGQYGHAWPIWLAAALSAINFIWAFTSLPESRPLQSQRSGRTIDPRALWNALQHPQVGVPIFLTFLVTCAFALMESSFPLVAEHQWKMGSAEVGRTFGVIGIIGILLQGGLIHSLTRRFGEAPLIGVGLFLQGVGLVSLAVTAQVPLSLVRWLGCVALAIGSSLVNPCLSALISKGVGADDQGAILGANQSLSALARAIAPTSSGPLYQSVSPAFPFQLSALIMLLASTLSWMRVRPTRPATH